MQARASSLARGREGGLPRPAHERPRRLRCNLSNVASVTGETPANCPPRHSRRTCDMSKETLKVSLPVELYYMHMLKKIGTTISVKNTDQSDLIMVGSTNIINDNGSTEIVNNEKEKSVPTNEDSDEEKLVGVDLIDLTEEQLEPVEIDIKVERAEKLSAITKRRLMKTYCKKRGMPLSSELNEFDEILNADLALGSPVSISPEPAEVEQTETEDATEDVMHIVETVDNETGIPDNEALLELGNAPVYSDVSSSSTPEPPNQNELENITEELHTDLQEREEPPPAPTTPGPVLPAWQSDFSSIFDTFPRDHPDQNNNDQQHRQANDPRNPYMSDEVSADPPLDAAFPTSQPLRPTMTRDFIPSEVSPNLPADAYHGMALRSNMPQRSFMGLDLPHVRYNNAPIRPIANHGNQQPRSYSMVYQAPDSVSPYFDAPARPAPEPVRRNIHNNRPYNFYNAGVHDQPLPMNGAYNYQEPYQNQWDVETNQYPHYEGGNVRSGAGGEHAPFYSPESYPGVQNTRPQMPTRFLPPVVEGYPSSRHRYQDTATNGAHHNLSVAPEPQAFQPYSRTGPHYRSEPYSRAAAHFNTGLPARPHQPHQPTSTRFQAPGEAPRAAARRRQRSNSIAVGEPAFFAPMQSAARAAPAAQRVARHYVPSEASVATQTVGVPPSPTRPEPTASRVSKSHAKSSEASLVSKGMVQQQSPTRPEPTPSRVPRNVVSSEASLASKNMPPPPTPARPEPTPSRVSRSAMPTEANVASNNMSPPSTPARPEPATSRVAKSYVMPSQANLTSKNMAPTPTPTSASSRILRSYLRSSETESASKTNTSVPAPTRPAPAPSRVSRSYVTPSVTNEAAKTTTSTTTARPAPAQLRVSRSYVMPGESDPAAEFTVPSSPGRTASTSSRALRSHATGNRQGVLPVVSSCFAVPTGEALRSSGQRQHRNSSAVSDGSIFASEPVSENIGPPQTPARPQQPASRMPINYAMDLESGSLPADTTCFSVPSVNHCQNNRSNRSRRGAVADAYFATVPQAVPEFMIPPSPARPAPRAARRVRSHSIATLPAFMNQTVQCELCNRICKSPAGLKIHQAKCKRDYFGRN